MSQVKGNTEYEPPIRGLCSIDFCPRVLFDVILRGNLRNSESEGQDHGVCCFFKILLLN